MSNIYLIEILINSEADLPKGEGWYFVNDKNGDVRGSYYETDPEVVESWLKHFSSYLLPVEPGVLYEKLSGENEYEKGDLITTSGTEVIWLRPL